MPVYPVAYRSAAAVLRGGFQIIPRLPPAPLPVLAFLLAFELAWRALDMWDRGRPFGDKESPWETETVDEVLPSVENELTYPLQDTVDYDMEGAVPVRTGVWTVENDCSRNPPCNAGFCSPRHAAYSSVFGTCNICYPLQPSIQPIAGYSSVYEMMVCPTAPSSHWAPWRLLRNPNWVVGSTVPVDPYGKLVPLDATAAAPASGSKRPVADTPYFPTPWSLPVRGFGEVRTPAYPVPGSVAPGSVAPGVVPGSVPGVIPGAGSGVGTGVGTGEIVVPLNPPIVFIPIGGSVAAFPAQPLGRNHFPPGKGKAEVKMRGKGAKGIRWLANFLTESKDFVEALWKALPKEMRSKCKGPRGGKAKCSLQEMLSDLYKARHYISENEDWVRRAVIEVIVNEIGDNFYGRAGQKFKEAGQSLREMGYWKDRPAGWQTGDRYRPRPKTPGSHTDYVHDWVETFVNSVW